MITGTMTVFSFWLLDTFPALANMDKLNGEKSYETLRRDVPQTTSFLFAFRLCLSLYR